MNNLSVLGLTADDNKATAGTIQFDANDGDTIILADVISEGTNVDLLSV